MVAGTYPVEIEVLCKQGIEEQECTSFVDFLPVMVSFCCTVMYKR